MGKLSDKPWFRKFLVSLVGKPLLKQFNKKSKCVQKTQEKLLKKFIDTSRDTVIGKEMGFGSIKSFEDYKKAVPIMNYEDHRPYIDRMMKGETDVLFPGKPIIYNTTSGTTSKPKMIPISEEYFERGTQDVNKLWLYSALKDNPNIYNGRSLSYVAPAVEGQVEDGTPYGSVSGLGFSNIPNILKATYSGPYHIVCIKNYDLKFYAIMRYALAESITIIICLNPSTYLRMQKCVMDEIEDMIRDIHDGTLRKDVADALPPSHKAECLAWLTPDPERARELESLYIMHGENLRFKHYWPDIWLINVWKQGNFRLMLPKLDGYFPEKTVYRAFGYQASEGRMGVTLGNDWAYSALGTHAFFFEFIREQDRHQEHPDTLMAYQLEEGKRYYLLQTNGSGLYRYDMNDIIEVVEHYNEVPCIKFIQKGEGITSLTGEKLSEIQVIDAVKAVTEEQGMEIEFYVLYCDFKDYKYKFFVEFAGKTEQKKLENFILSLDNKLKEYNEEWETKRGTGRLDMPEIFILQKDSQTRLKENLVKKGLAREAQFKDLYLTKKMDVYEELVRLKKRYELFNKIQYIF
jgi:hypothetical protein